MSDSFFVLQLRLPIASVRILTFEFCGTVVCLTSPPLSLIFFVTWLVAGRDGQVHHEGAKESAQETDPIDQDPLRRFSRILRIFAENVDQRGTKLRNDHVFGECGSCLETILSKS